MEGAFDPDAEAIVAKALDFKVDCLNRMGRLREAAELAGTIGSRLETIFRSTTPLDGGAALLPALDSYLGAMCSTAWAIDSLGYAGGAIRAYESLLNLFDGRTDEVSAERTEWIQTQLERLRSTAR